MFYLKIVGNRTKRWSRKWRRTFEGKRWWTTETFKWTQVFYKFQFYLRQVTYGWIFLRNIYENERKLDFSRSRTNSGTSASDDDEDNAKKEADDDDEDDDDDDESGDDAVENGGESEQNGNYDNSAKVILL